MAENIEVVSEIRSVETIASGPSVRARELLIDEYGPADEEPGTSEDRQAYKKEESMIRILNGGGGLLAAGALLAAFAVYSVWPSIDVSGFNIVAGALVFVADLVFRVVKLRPQARITADQPNPVGASALTLRTDLSKFWLTGAGGPKLLGLPAWLFGLGWVLFVGILPWIGPTR